MNRGVFYKGGLRMKKKILVGLAALAVIAGFSAFAATPSAQDAPLSNSYGQGYCYDGNDGYCQGPRRGGCYNGQNNCYNDNGYCQGPRRGCRANTQAGCQGWQNCPAYDNQR